MNLTISNSTNHGAWKQIKARYLVVIGGAALVASLAISGSTVMRTHNAATVAAPMASNPADPMFATAADAEQAAQTLVALTETSKAAGQPQFATEADAEYAVRGLVQVALSAKAAAVQPLFANAADAEDAGRALVNLPDMARRQTVEPQFATDADAEFAARTLGPEFAIR